MEKLNTLVDESDPDVSNPSQPSLNDKLTTPPSLLLLLLLRNTPRVRVTQTSLSQIEHLLQTAEAIRRDGKPEWMQVVGLVHDLGKLLFLFDSQ